MQLGVSVLLPSSLLRTFGIIYREHCIEFVHRYMVDAIACIVWISDSVGTLRMDKSIHISCANIRSIVYRDIDSERPLLHNCQKLAAQ